MNHENPWDIALPLITSNGEADKLNTTTIEILNRLSDKANPNTGFAITRPDELARDAKRSIEDIRKRYLFCGESIGRAARDFSKFPLA